MGNTRWGCDATLRMMSDHDDPSGPLEDRMQRLVSDQGMQGWLDLKGEQHQLEEALTELVQWSPSMREEVLAGRAAKLGEDPPNLPPKAKAFAHVVFARAYPLRVVNDGEILAAEQVHVIAAEAFAITLRFPQRRWQVDPATTVDPVRSTEEVFDCAKVEQEILDLQRQAAPGVEMFGLAVAAAVLDKVVDSAFDTLTTLRARVDELEQDIMDTAHAVRSQGTHLLRQTLAIRKNLRMIRWTFLPADEIDELVSGPFRDVDRESRGVRFRIADLRREADRAVVAVRDVIEQIEHTVELSNALKADRLNDTIYTLTVVATVLLVPTLIAGIYGMNFDGLPGAHYRHGFWLTLVGMIALATAIWFGIHVFLDRQDKEPGARSRSRGSQQR